MHPSDPVSLLGMFTSLQRHAELLVAQTTGVEWVELEAVCENSERYARRFYVGDQVLVVRGKALNTNVKWPAFKSKYYQICRVTKAKHPATSFCRKMNRVTREGAHAR